MKAIQVEEKIILRLDNGKGKVKAMFMTANIDFFKDIDMVGMNGPKR
jgi:hypothetical protein